MPWDIEQVAPESCPRCGEKDTEDRLGGWQCQEEGFFCEKCGFLTRYCERCITKGNLIELTLVDWELEGEIHNPPFTAFYYEITKTFTTDDSTIWHWKCPVCLEETESNCD